MMNANEMKSIARANVMSMFEATLEENAAVQFGDAQFAILQTVDEQEIWVEVSFKTKAYKPTKVNPAFDPYEVAEVWKTDKAIKEQEKADKAAEKARKAAEKNA